MRAPIRLLGDPVILVSLTLITLLLAAARSSAGSADAPPIDKVLGFRSVTFGDPPPAEMAIAETDGDLKFYHRPSDQLKIGRASLAEIIYGFYKAQFFVAILKTKGEQNSRALLDVFDDAYGTPTRDLIAIHRSIWTGKKNSASFSEDAFTGNAKAAIVNNAISAQHDAGQAAQAQ